jgi:hypothetical protein
MGRPIIIEKAKVKDYPEFQKVEDSVRSEAVKAAKDAWGLDYGGLFPGDGQYGETPIRLPYFNLGTTSGTAETWRRTFTNTGWQSLIADKKTIEDCIIGLIGWEIASPTKKIAAIYQKYGERTFPVINFETEIELFEVPQILFSKGIVIPEETNVDVDVLVTSTGAQIIRPLGFAFVKKPLLIAKKPV